MTIRAAPLVQKKSCYLEFIWSQHNFRIWNDLINKIHENVFRWRHCESCPLLSFLYCLFQHDIPPHLIMTGPLVATWLHTVVFQRWRFISTDCCGESVLPAASSLLWELNQSCPTNVIGTCNVRWWLYAYYYHFCCSSFLQFWHWTEEE